MRARAEEVSLVTRWCFCQGERGGEERMVVVGFGECMKEREEVGEGKEEKVFRDVLES